MTALDHLDAVIALIRAAKSGRSSIGLMNEFKLSEIQSKAILKRLQRLTGLDVKNKAEYKEVMDKIEYYHDVWEMKNSVSRLLKMRCWK